MRWPFLVALVALVSGCAIWPTTKSCAEMVATDAASEVGPAIRRTLENPNYETVKREMAVFVTQHGLAFVRCMVENIRAQASQTLGAQPHSEIQGNAEAWLSESEG